ncbi:DNA-directed RNA polymerase subunit beta [Gossypium arboreum]|uniref:DNA-directed RNA polymerase subunit beta n=1 Tax=Gossypium arboreum TaxID=29729 RepID=A0A0B0PWG8_GOSAR|nr:DNA-directed RNA polymerase subunit beta [Gossypium arboreum]
MPHNTLPFQFWSWLNKELNVSLKDAKKEIQELSIHHHMHHYKLHF